MADGGNQLSLIENLNKFRDEDVLFTQTRVSAHLSLAQCLFTVPLLWIPIFANLDF